MSEEKVWSVYQGSKDGKPAFLSFRNDIKSHPQKSNFPWLLKISVQIESTRSDGLTDDAEAKLLNEFEDSLEENFKEYTEVIYLGRVTWNGWRVLYFQVQEPKALHSYLHTLIAINEYSREFEYQMEKDEDWSIVEGLFQLEEVK